MLKRLLNTLPVKTVSAHCDIPCKIYDPISAQLAAISVVRFLDIINETIMDDAAGHATFSRLVAEKEIHAEKVKHEIRVIWGDYIKDPQLEKFPELHSLTHSIMLQGSKCKQSLDRSAAEELLAKVNQFAEIFWKTKDVATYRAKAPYPPALEMVYPDLKG